MTILTSLSSFIISAEWSHIRICVFHGLYNKLGKVRRFVCLMPLCWQVVKNVYVDNLSTGIIILVKIQLMEMSI